MGFPRSPETRLRKAGPHAACQHGSHRRRHRLNLPLSPQLIDASLLTNPFKASLEEAAKEVTRPHSEQDFLKEPCRSYGQGGSPRGPATFLSNMNFLRAEGSHGLPQPSREKALATKSVSFQLRPELTLSPTPSLSPGSQFLVFPPVVMDTTCQGSWEYF